MRIPERSLQRKSGARERSHKRQAHMTDLENIIDTVKDGVLLQTQTYDLIEYLRLTGGIANNFGGASKVIRVIITEVKP